MAAEEEAHPTTPPPQMVVVNLHMLEFSRTELGKLDSEPYGGSKDMSVLELLTELRAPGGKQGETASADPKLLSLVEALRKDDLMLVVAQPSVMTLSDWPVYIRLGGHIDYPVKDSQGIEVTKTLEYGLQSDVTPHVESTERIHLDFRLCKSELDEAHSVQVGDQKIPALIAREVEAGVDLRSGQTLVVNGGVPRRTRESPAVDEFSTLVLVKAEIVTKGNANVLKAAVRR